MPYLGFGRQSAQEGTQGRDEDEQVATFVEAFLNHNTPRPITREELLQNHNNLQQINNNDRFSFFKNFIDIIGFGLFPILLARIIKNLLSAVTFSTDIIQDVFEYYYSTPYIKDNLILKFSQIIMYELGKDELTKVVKLITIFTYVGYSVLISSYMIFTFVFYFLCLVLTTTRRWSEVDKFLLNVFRNSNGVF